MEENNDSSIGNEYNLFKERKNYIPFSLIPRRKQ